MATNEEVIGSVASEMPTEFAEKITGMKATETWEVMEEYPNIANSFIKTLTNKVTKSVIYSKIFENPLKFLKKPMLHYGDSIEELFVEMAQVKGFTGHWHDESKTPEADLIRKLIPEVSALYISINVDYKLKTTVMDKSLRKAFFQEGGLSNLVGQIIASITSSAEYKEFKLTKDVYQKLIAEGKAIKKINEDGTVEYTEINNGLNLPIKQTPYIVKIEGSTSKEKMLNLSESIRETVGYMKFPSEKYNLAGKLVWSKPEEMMLVTTPTTKAKLDVQALAHTFNISLAELNTRTILVDEMPEGIFKAGETELVDKIPSKVDAENAPTLDKTKKPIAILMSNDLLQIRDTHQGAGTFHNPEGEYTNHFANREGIFSVCLFENLAVFYE